MVKLVDTRLSKRFDTITNLLVRSRCGEIGKLSRLKICRLTLAGSIPATDTKPNILGVYMLPKHSIDKLFFSLISEGRFRTTKFGKVFCSASGKRVDKQQSDGYMRVTLRLNGETIGIQAHRLLWMKRNKRLIPKKIVINHINGVVTDNSVKNLELATYGENTSHALQNFGHSANWKVLQTEAKQGEKNTNSKFSDSDVAKLRKQFSKHKNTVQNIIDSFEVSEQTAIHMLLGVTYSHIGYAVSKTDLGIRQGSTGRKPALTDNDFEKIHKYRLKGMSFNAIHSKYLGVISYTNLIKNYKVWSTT